VRTDHEGQMLSLCALTTLSNTAAKTTSEVTVAGRTAALEMRFPSGGVLRMVGVGRHGQAGELNASVRFGCGRNFDSGSSESPFAVVSFVDQWLNETLQSAALFDLGPTLSWVPRRIATRRYSVTVVNNELQPVPLAIKSLIGPVKNLKELPLDQSEKNLPVGQGWLPFGYDNNTVRAGLGKNTDTQIMGLDTRCFLIELVSDSTTAIDSARATVPPPPPRLLRLSPGAGTLRDEILKRPSFRNYFSGVVLDWRYIESRSEESLVREARWWEWQKLTIVVDFTSGTTVFPGPLRLSDDWWYKNASASGGPWYSRSMERLSGVLRKMPLCNARDALLTLHGVGGLGGPTPPPPPDMVDLFRQTFVKLHAIASPLNVTLHLRQTGRNGILRRTKGGSPPLNLSVQAEFVQSVCAAESSPCVKVAPQLAANSSLAEVRALVEGKSATLLLLSAEANAANPRCTFNSNPGQDGQACVMADGPNPGGPPGGGKFKGPTEGAPLVTLNSAGRAALLEWASVPGTTLILDAVPAADGTAGREAELEDVVLTERAQA